MVTLPFTPLAIVHKVWSTMKNLCFMFSTTKSTIPRRYTTIHSEWINIKHVHVCSVGNSYIVESRQVRKYAHKTIKKIVYNFYVEKKNYVKQKEKEKNV